VVGRWCFRGLLGRAVVREADVGRLGHNGAWVLWRIGIVGKRLLRRTMGDVLAAALGFWQWLAGMRGRTNNESLMVRKGGFRW
jgi:hypothetical protein